MEADKLLRAFYRKKKSHRKVNFCLTLIKQANIDFMRYQNTIVAPFAKWIVE